MSETHLSNDPSARTPTGEIKDQTPPPTPTPTPDPAKPADAPPPAPAPEPKPDDKQPSLLNEKKDGKEPDKAGPPEKYEAFTLPEGYEFNPDKLADVHKVFKETGLNQTQAQSLVDFYSKELVDAEKAPYKLWEDTQQKWRDEIKLDPELGGKLDQVKSSVARMIDGLGDPKLAADFRQAMDFTGAGNNPAFIRAFYKLAQRMVEGGPAQGGGPTPPPGQKPASAAAAIYPNLKSG